LLKSFSFREVERHQHQIVSKLCAMVVGTLIKVGLNVLSLTPIPGVSNAAGAAIGVIDICTGSPVTGTIGLATSVLPCGALFGKGAGKLIALTSKGSTANRTLKIGAKVAGNVDHIVAGYKAASKGVNFVTKGIGYIKGGNNLKSLSNTVKVVKQAKDVQEAGSSAFKVMDYTIRCVKWCGKVYLKG
jgi:hypothetical protein